MYISDEWTQIKGTVQGRQVELRSRRPTPFQRNPDGMLRRDRRIRWTEELVKFSAGKPRATRDGTRAGRYRYRSPSGRLKDGRQRIRSTQGLPGCPPYPEGRGNHGVGFTNLAGT